MCLDIFESYFEKVWYLAAILDALARLQTTMSRDLICANSARSTPTKFFPARSLRQWLLYMYYLNSAAADHTLTNQIRWLPAPDSYKKHVEFWAQDIEVLELENEDN